MSGGRKFHWTQPTSGFGQCAKCWGWGLWNLHHGFWWELRGSFAGYQGIPWDVRDHRKDPQHTCNVQIDILVWGLGWKWWKADVVQFGNIPSLTWENSWFATEPHGKHHVRYTCTWLMQNFNQKIGGWSWGFTRSCMGQQRWAFELQQLHTDPAHEGSLLQGSCCCFRLMTLPSTWPAICWQCSCTRSGPPYFFSQDFGHDIWAVATCQPLLVDY